MVDFTIASGDLDSKILEMMDKESLIAVLAVGGGLLVAIVAIIFGAFKAMVVSSNREKTKREMAAYVAEGSIDPDKAVAILESDKPRWEKAKHT